MNYFIKAFKNYINFKGRARRSEFWYFFLINVAISIGLNFLAAAIHFPLLASIYALITLLPSLAVGVRRMHDIGKSGWFILIPLYNIYLATIRGNNGANLHGADPVEHVILGS